MINNDDIYVNGEFFFYSSIESNLKIVFDIGCRYDSLFREFGGDVHYFDPNKESIEKLKNQPNRNKRSYFNNIALSDKTGEMFYYPKYQSLHNRIKTCNTDDDENKQVISVLTGDDYIKTNNINKVDFLKIDVEGHELAVLKGFSESISKVSIIQFEYGGTYIDTGVKLADIRDQLSGTFDTFYYLTTDRMIKITNFKDHYNYCNIVAFNKNYDTIYYKEMIHE